MGYIKQPTNPYQHKIYSYSSRNNVYQQKQQPISNECPPPPNWEQSVKIMQRLKQQSHSAKQLKSAYNPYNYTHKNPPMQYQTPPMQHNIPKHSHPMMLQQSQTSTAKQQMISIRNSASMPNVFQAQVRNMPHLHSSQPHLKYSNQNSNQIQIRKKSGPYQNNFINKKNYNQQHRNIMPNNNHFKTQNVKPNNDEGLFIPPAPQSVQEIKKYHNWKHQRKLRDQNKA